MVSTRGVRFKFSEGERVLCYEPDPTKAKVLYESKVLDTVVSKDAKGRKYPEYLIHFNGWSNSWDRCVTEEFVLKDNEENRDLQRRLSEIAAVNLLALQLQTRPVHRKSKRKRRRLSESLSFTSKNRSDDDDNDDGKDSDADSNASSCSSSAEESEDDDDDDDDEVRKLDLKFPEVLREKLEEVHQLVKQSGKLISLPCTPNVISILENYVSSYASNAFSVPGRRRINRSYILSDKNINICKEVMEGIRIYFDFMLPLILLYDEERAQYQEFMEDYKPLWVRDTEVSDSVMMMGTPIKSNDMIHSDACDETDVDASTHCMLGSPVSQEMSSTESQKHIPEKTGKNINFEENAVGLTRRVLRSTASRLEVAAKCNAASFSFKCQDLPNEASPPSEVELESGKLRDDKGSKPGRTQHRLTSQSSSGKSEGRALNSNIPEQPLSPTQSQQLTTDLPLSQRRHAIQPTSLTPITTHISSSSSTHSGTSTPPAKQDYNNTRRDCTNQTKNPWQMIPQSVYEQVPPPPSLIYGAQHLLRLFVKLPDMLTRTNIVEHKLKAIHNHLELFLKYMSDHHDELLAITKFEIDAKKEESVEPSDLDCPG